MCYFSRFQRFNPPLKFTICCIYLLFEIITYLSKCSHHESECLYIVMLSDASPYIGMFHSEERSGASQDWVITGYPGALNKRLQYFSAFLNSISEVVFSASLPLFRALSFFEASVLLSSSVAVASSL